MAEHLPPRAEYADLSPAEIRRKVAAYRAHKQAMGRRRQGWFRAVLLLGALLLAGPWLLRHGLPHGRRSHCPWLTHMHMRHQR